MQYEKVHPLDLQEDVTPVMTDEEVTGFMDIAKSKDHWKALAQLHRRKHKRVSSIECFREMMIEAQSSVPTFLDSYFEDFRDKRDLVTIF